MKRVVFVFLLVFAIVLCVFPNEVVAGCCTQPGGGTCCTTPTSGCLCAVIGGTVRNYKSISGYLTCGDNYPVRDVPVAVQDWELEETKQTNDSGWYYSGREEDAGYWAHVRSQAYNDGHTTYWFTNPQYKKDGVWRSFTLDPKMAFNITQTGCNQVQSYCQESPIGKGCYDYPHPEPVPRYQCFPGSHDQVDFLDFHSGACERPNCSTMSVKVNGVERTTVYKGETASISLSGVFPPDGASGLNNVSYHHTTATTNPPLCDSSVWTTITSSSGTAPINWNTSSLATGTYWVVANVYDKYGNKCYSNPAGTCGIADSYPSTCRKQITIANPVNSTLRVYARDIGSTAATCATVRVGTAASGVAATVGGTAKTLTADWSLAAWSTNTVSVSTVPAGYNSGSYVFCPGTSGETDRSVGSTKNVTVGVGTTNYLYIGLVKRGSLAVIGRGVTAPPTTCAQVVSGTNLGGSGARASIVGQVTNGALNYVTSLNPGNYTVTGTSAPVGYSGYYMCTGTGGTPVMSSRTATVSTGTTAYMYVGYLQRGSLNVIGKGVTVSSPTCAQIVSAANVSGGRATVAGANFTTQTLSLNPSFQINNLVPQNYTVTGTSAPAGYSGYYLCVGTGGTPTITSRSIGVIGGSTANMYVGYVSNPTLSGTMYDRTGIADEAVCVSSPRLNGAVVTLSQGGVTRYTATAGSDGRYSLTVAPGTYTMVVNPPSGYYYDRSCDGGSYPPPDGGSLTISAGVNMQRSFTFYRTFSGWFQASGDVYGGRGITQTIPVSCSLPSCSPYLILKELTNNQTGLARIKEGEIYLGSNGMVSDEGYNAVSGPMVGTKIYDFDYYKVRASRFAQTPWDGYFPLPIYTQAEGDDFQVLTKYESGSSVNINSPLTIPSGEKRVLLINGSVTVNENITVEVGGYLAVVAKGTITFESNVTNAQGVFVANSIVVSSTNNTATEQQFNGYGSFVGYNNISLLRDRGIINNTEPTEKFTFRPDLFLNSPLPMLIRDFVWREVVPR